MKLDTRNGLLAGELLAGPSAHGDPRLDKDETTLENLRQTIVFATDQTSIAFQSQMRQYIPIEDGDIRSEQEVDVYYPYYNETSATIRPQGTPGVELELIQEDVALRYHIIGDDIFIRSQLESTAYSPNYVAVDGEIYAVEGYFLQQETHYENDEFLGIPAQGDGLRTENLRTGLSAAVDRDAVAERIESDAHNGALKLRNPDMASNSPVHTLTDQLGH